MDIEIRPLRVEDAKISVTWRNNPEIWKTTINSPDQEISLKDELDWMNKVLAETDSERFAIIADHQYVGNVQLTNIQNNESYFGIFIGEVSFWGKGVGTLATIKILKHAFENLKLSIIKLRVKEGNYSAYRIYNKLGFKNERIEEGIIHMKLTKEKWRIQGEKV